MYQFASYITTATLSGILVAILIMFLMTIFALFNRAAMGSKKDRRGKNESGDSDFSLLHLKNHLLRLYLLQFFRSFKSFPCGFSSLFFLGRGCGS